MNNKKFILNSDDFGLSKEINRAVLNGYNDGFLTSASICANGKAYKSAIDEILPECPNLGLGVHLNIVEGKSLTKVPLLTDKNGEFNNGFLKLLLKSKNEALLKDIEKEFRAQIESVINHAKIDHIDSHVHIHAIPEIFKITAKLAKEYNISFVRTQYEEMYFVPDFKKHFNLKYPPNILKIIILNIFSKKNKKVLKDYSLKTNDYIIGVGYTGLMDEKTIEYGLSALDGNYTVEAVIHPSINPACTGQRYREFKLTQSKELKDKIKRLGFEITNYKNLL